MSRHDSKYDVYVSYKNIQHVKSWYTTAEICLGMRPTNEISRYNVATSLIDCAHT